MQSQWHVHVQVLLIEADGAVYEFNGRRGLPPLLSFAQGGFHNQLPKMQAPAKLLPNASDWWLLWLVMWRPLSMSLGLAFGLAIAIKGCSLLLLRMLRPPEQSKTARNKTLKAE